MSGVVFVKLLISSLYEHADSEIAMKIRFKASKHSLTLFENNKCFDLFMFIVF